MRKLEKLKNVNFDSCKLSDANMSKLTAGLVGETFRGCTESTVQNGMGDIQSTTEKDDGTVVASGFIVYGPAWPL